MRLALAVLGLLGAARAVAAPQIALDHPTGPPVVGREQTVRVLIFDEGAPVPQLPGPLAVSAGALRGPPQPIAPGQWEVRWVPPVETGPVRFSAGPVAATVEVQPIESPPIAMNVRGTHTALSRDPIEVEVTLAEGSQPEDLVVAVSEGQLAPPEVDGPLLRLRWTPEPTPFARPAVIMAMDRRAPTAAPASAVVELRARPSVPVQTEPGVAVEIEVGRRRYGPVVAGPDGVARAQIEVRPGESVATITLRDPGGRTATSALPLAGDQRPVLVALASGAHARDDAAPLAWLAGVEPDGDAWGGKPPACARSDRATVEVQPGAPGAWVVVGPAPSAADPGDLRVDCGLGLQARASAVISRVTDVPARILLRMTPTELDADAPFGLLVATVETAAGDRLPVDRLQLTASYGVLEARSDGFALRASYDGRAALAQGKDMIRASWASEAGKGSVAHVDLDVIEREGGGGVPALRVRPRSWAGAGLVDQQVRVDIPGVGALEGRSGADGSLIIPLTASQVPPLTLTVMAGGLLRSRTIGWDRAALPAADAPEVQAELRVPVFSGRVRGVFITSEPRTVEVGPQARALVRVRLLDAAGNPVDAPVELHASSGVIGEARRRVDGAVEATFSPGEDFTTPSVRITASSPTGAFAATSTEIELTPRVLRVAPGVQGGWMLGARGVNGPYGALTADKQLEGLSPRLYLRAGAALYGASASEDDVQIDLSVVPITLGASVRGARGRTSGWVGAAGALAPYRIQARSAQGSLGSGVGLSSPGVQLFTGAAVRRRTAELGGELGWLFLTLPDGDLSWQGSVGGLAAGLSYRLLY